ncbi:hypothetical protein ACFV84_36095 [Kitasatospora sp. NPDC059811]|uniref:hypothetical protein n=1 Tax=Streptomycetaceae TaxID=2062 RepID=UPI0007AF41EE|nr:hypothetical protein [Streptomyces sp. MJM8645]
MADGAQFVVGVDTDPLALLNARVEAERAKDEAWLAKAREVLAGLSKRQAASERREIRRRHATLRAAGKLAGTRDLVMARALRAELEARGLDQEWPEPPRGEVDAPGRRLGVSPRRHGRQIGEGGFPQRLAVTVDLELATTVRRAAYWTSAEVYEQLRAWELRWGDGPEVALREAERNGVPGPLALLSAAGRRAAPAEALEERERLRALILTTGDLVRAAVDRAGHGADVEAPKAVPDPGPTPLF